MKLFNFLLTFLTLFFVWEGRSGTISSPKAIKFNHINLADGLPNNRVDCMIQDHEGYLWFGTKRGLCRYNGYDFKTYKRQANDSTSLPYAQITSLLESADGTIWVGIWNGGLYKYNRREDNFTRVNLEKKLSSVDYQDFDIHVLFEDSNNDLWVGSTLGLFLIKGERKEKVTEIKLNGTDGFLESVSTIYEDDAGVLYFGTNGVNQMYTCPRNSKQVNPLDLRSEGHVFPEGLHQIFPIEDDQLWIAADNGLFMMDKQTHIIKQVVEEGSPQPETALTFIIQSSDHQLWLGGDGLYSYDNKKKKFAQINKQPEKSNTLTGNLITCALKDDQNNLWFGTFSKGLNVIYHQTKNFSKNPKLTERLKDYSENINAIYENKEGVLFLGTWDKGLIIVDKNNHFVNTELEFPKLKHLGNAPIRSIVSDKKGVIWIGSHGGLITRLNFRNKLIETYQLPFPGIKEITSLFIDRGNTMWVGTNTNLYKFDPGSSSFNPIMNNVNILDMEEDEQGNLWCATYNQGLCLITKDGEITSFKSKSNLSILPQSRIISLLKDSKKQMWVGTEFNGLFLYNPESHGFEQFTTKDGLVSNDVCSIQEDAQNNLWIGTNQGLSQFDFSSKKFNNYTLSDGLNGDEFHYNSIFKNASGNLYFGCTDGLVYFDPNDIKENEQTLNVKIEAVFVNNGSVTRDLNNNGIASALKTNLPIHLKYDQNTLIFHYTSINLSGKKKSNFAYQLIGQDKDYHYVNDRRHINYVNLNPGRYTFKVIASNNDDVWTEQGAEMTFIIENPPWLSWWAYVSYGLLLLLLLYGFRFQILHREKMKSAIELERIEKNQEKELSQMKLRFFTNISHEFKTPLTLIIGPLEQILVDLHGNSGLKTKLLTISNNSKRLLNLVNQLIDFRKIEQDVLPLNKTRNDLIETTRKIMALFHTVALNNTIQFSIDTQLKSLLFNYDSDKIEKVLNNLLSNAFKYTPKGGKISIHISRNEETIVSLSISDTGSGIAADRIRGVADRFNTQEIDAGNMLDMESSGIGLSYSKKLIELHQGTFQVESKPNQGTQVTFEIPYDTQLISSTQIVSVTKIQKNSNDTLKVLEDTPNETSVSEPEKAINLTTGPRILIVEDDHELRQYITSILSPLFQIDEAINGQIGLDMALENDYDLIVSDVMMPNMSGTQLCEKLKSNIKTSHIFVILLTAKSDIDSQNEGYETGADSYMTKPFLPNQLILVVKNLLKTQRHIKVFFTSNEGNSEEPIGIHPRDKKFIEDAIKIIEENIDQEQFGVEVLGKELALSRTHLFRKFKSLTGIAPNDYIRQIRLKKASQLILEGNHSISEIGYMVGFKTPANFSTSFKSFFGKSPNNYRGK
ncbi:MAG: response regulator [Reichenbachiella sp.]